MANGLLGGLGKLLHMGALYVQHVQAARAAAQMQQQQACRYLYEYLGALSEAEFNGFKISVAMAANGEQEPHMRHTLSLIAANADALRAQAPAVPEAVATTALPAAAPSFEQAVQQVTTWYQMVGQGQAAAAEQALHDLVEGADEGSFSLFVEHLDQMLANLQASIQAVRDNEANAWGGCVEDRIAYLSAKVRSGASDPRVEAQVREYEQQHDFVLKVREIALGCWNARAAQRFEAPETAPELPADEPGEADVGDAPGSMDAIFEQLESLRQSALASGQLREERDYATRAWLDELKGVMAAKAEGSMSGSEAIAAIQRMAAKRKEMIVDAGPDIAAELPEGSRARALVGHLKLLKDFAFGALAGVPAGQTHTAFTELYTNVARAFAELPKLAEDTRALQFERTELRPLAQQAHELALLPHLTLARPFWDTPRADASASRVFYAGEADLAALLGQALAGLRLELASARPGRYYGQARWDQLRESFVAVFDWRSHSRELAEHDPAGAAQLAAAAYELGLALAMGHPVVIVGRAGQAMPFDIDIDPVNMCGDAAADVAALTAALDHAIYDRQRVADDPCLAATRAGLVALAAGRGKARVFEGMGWLAEDNLRDPVAFLAAARQMLREEAALELLTPVWPTPAEHPQPTLFHVTPFSLDWSSAARKAVRRACADCGIRHADGATAKESRILRRIWDGIATARWVLVDVTGLNPNVFIELGMAHALGRDTLIVERGVPGEAPPPKLRNLEKIEFKRYADLAGLRALIADWVSAVE
jgi:hypothetical protein